MNVITTVVALIALASTARSEPPSAANDTCAAARLPPRLVEEVARAASGGEVNAVLSSDPEQRGRNRAWAVALCKVRQERAAAQSKYREAYAKYLDVAAGGHSAATIAAIRRKQKQLVPLCIALRSETHRFHTAESLLADEEYRLGCYLAMARVFDRPDDIDNVRRNLPEWLQY